MPDGGRVTGSISDAGSMPTPQGDFVTHPYNFLLFFVVSFPFLPFPVVPSGGRVTGCISDAGSMPMPRPYNFLLFFVVAYPFLPFPVVPSVSC